MPRPTIWARPERAAKGPAPSLSRTQIAATAIALADAEGLLAVSKRRLAGELSAAATSLYGYVVRKDELYDLIPRHDTSSRSNLVHGKRLYCQPVS